MKKGNETRAIKIFHNDSQIKQAILPETMQEMGMDAIKRYFNNVYKGEARALEKVNTIDPEHIYTVRSLFRWLVHYAVFFMIFAYSVVTTANTRMMTFEASFLSTTKEYRYISIKKRVNSQNGMCKGLCGTNSHLGACAKPFSHTPQLHLYRFGQNPCWQADPP